MRRGLVISMVFLLIAAAFPMTHVVSQSMPENDLSSTPPVITLYFDPVTGIVTLIAYDFPLDKASGVNATYYRIDDGDIQRYTGPFKLPEGRHTVEYWSVDNVGNIEPHKIAELLLDTTPPTVEFVEPLPNRIYLFGSPITSRMFNNVTLCIGKVPIAVVADDHDGSGIRMVLFTMNNETAYDETPDEADRYTCIYRHVYFGTLAITAVAMDKKGYVSEPVTITVKVCGLGLL